MADYSRAIELAPQDARALNNRGALLLRMGKLAEACDDLERSVFLEPGYAAAAKNLEACRQWVQAASAADAELTAHLALEGQRGIGGGGGEAPQGLLAAAAAAAAEQRGSE